MTILLLLIPLSLLLLGVAIWAFVWAVRSGQFDDLDSAAIDVLTDDTATSRPRSSVARTGQHTGPRDDHAG